MAVAADAAELEAFVPEEASCTEPPTPSREARGGARCRVAAAAGSLAAAALLAAALSAPALGARGRAAPLIAGSGTRAEELFQAPPAQCGAAAPGVVFEYEYSVSVTNIPSLAACCAKCESVPLCKAWTWVQTGTLQAGVPECFLKSGKLSSRAERAGVQSGFLPARANLLGTGIQMNYKMNYQALHTVDRGFDCDAGPLPSLWSPATATGPAARVRLLSFNLMWWNVFDRGGPSDQHRYKGTPGNRAVSLIAAQAPFDIMGFQECMDLKWLLRHAGMDGQYSVFDGQDGVCLAIRRSVWTLIGMGLAHVAEDQANTYWGKRPAQWVRVRHRTSGAKLLFVNHHGPLPIDTGGACGPVATARNLLSLIADKGRPGDAVVIVGDFNARFKSQTVQHLLTRLRCAANREYDRILTNLDAGAVVGTADIGSGGSDHHALSAEISLGR